MLASARVCQSTLHKSPPLVHVRLVHWPPFEIGHTPAVAVGESLACEATPAVNRSIDASALPPSAPPPSAPPPSSPPPLPAPTSLGRDDDEESFFSDQSRTVPGDPCVDIEYATIGWDIAALAPAPSPAFLPGESGQDVLPHMPPAVPCHLRVPVPPATCKKPVVAGPEDSDDEPVLKDTWLTNPTVAANMLPFLHSLQVVGWNRRICRIRTQLSIAGARLVPRSV